MSSQMIHVPSWNAHMIVLLPRYNALLLVQRPTIDIIATSCTHSKYHTEYQSNLQFISVRV